VDRAFRQQLGLKLRVERFFWKQLGLFGLVEWFVGK
jgi:hypothetical protein